MHHQYFCTYSMPLPLQVYTGYQYRRCWKRKYSNIEFNISKREITVNTTSSSIYLLFFLECFCDRLAVSLVPGLLTTDAVLCVAITTRSATTLARGGGPGLALTEHTLVPSEAKHKQSTCHLQNIYNLK